MSKLSVSNRRFFLDDKEIKIISGAMHYFRTFPEQWEDRLRKLKACGFNTVETYVPWNLHEPQEGQFDFEGLGDIEKFIEVAGSLGLYVIVRPGPYICAEWEFGGLPSWLLMKKGMQLRCHNQPFLQAVDAFYDQLMPRLKPYLSTNGGPVIAMQVENEYGSYGDDKDYLSYIEKSLLERGMDVMFFTSDGPSEIRLDAGTLPHVYKTANFGSRAQEAFEVLEKYEKDGPMMCMEFWLGWFDHWGDIHHTRDVESTIKEFDYIVEKGAVNCYMFHGGTNFGFYSGANVKKGILEPTITSYDYDAILTEAGDPTEKYYAIQESLARLTGKPKAEVPPASKKKSYGQLKLDLQSTLNEQLSSISKTVKAAYPMTMEEMGQNYGYIRYTTNVPKAIGEIEVLLEECHDRAIVYLNSKQMGIVDRTKENHDEGVKLNITEANSEVEVLVENLGRVNYGYEMYKEQKGIVGGILFNKDYPYNHFGWTMDSIPLDDVSKLDMEQFHKTEEKVQERPTFYKGTLLVDEVADTFISMEGWTKGVVFVNGFNLGRYWHIGPQTDLYVPAPLLNEGENSVLIFELEGCKDASVSFNDTRNWL